MISAKNSRMLAIKKQMAVQNKDFKMIKKLERIKDDKEITNEIIKYKSIKMAKN